MFKLKVIFYYIQFWMLPKFKSRIDLHEWQENKLRVFFNRTLINSRFYKDFFKDGQLDLRNVPIIEKTEFMEQFNHINTVGIDRDEAMTLAIESEKSRNFKSEINGITVGLSTGTSGKRGIFLVSESERAQWVGIVMNRILKPKLFQKQKIAFFLRANSNLYTSVQSNLFEFQYFDIFRPTEALIQEVNAYQPDILAAQPSILLEIARAQHFNVIQLEINQIISFAEVLHDHDAYFIEKSLKAQIQEIYQCTEGLLGFTCKEGTMHLNEDVIHVEQEWIDDNKFHPIITDFTRKSQPVVRYRMNDILQIKQTPCACGSTFMAIEKIIGRDDDVLIIENVSIFPDVISRKIALATNEFFNYEIVQIGNFELNIHIDCSESDFDSTNIKITQILKDIFAINGIKSEVKLNTTRKSITLNGNKRRKIRRQIDEN